MLHIMITFCKIGTTFTKLYANVKRIFFHCYEMITNLGWLSQRILFFIYHSTLLLNMDVVYYMRVVFMHRPNSQLTNLGVDMARFTQFPLMITRWAIIYEIISPGAAGSSIYF